MYFLLPWPPRPLVRKLKQAAGYTVKEVSGLLRFEQAHNHFWRQPKASLAGPRAGLHRPVAPGPEV